MSADEREDFGKQGRGPAAARAGEGIDGTEELWMDGQRLVPGTDLSATVEASLDGDGSARLMVTVVLGSPLRPHRHSLERELAWPGD